MISGVTTGIGQAPIVGRQRAGGRTRILFLIDAITVTGGAERFALGLATHLPQDRFDVWLCTSRRADPEGVRQLHEAGIHHLHLGRQSKWDVYRFDPLIRLLRRERFDVLHAHMFGSNIWGSLLGRFAGVPVIVAHEHNWSFSGEPLRVWLDREVVGRVATQFVTVSEATRRMMVEVERIPADKILVLPTAYLPHRRSRGGRIDVRAELGLSGQAPIVVTAAQLRPEKALEVMIEAQAEVARRVPGAILLIIGDGSCRERLEHHTRTLGLEPSVRFLGRRNDVDEILAQCEVCAMSSDWEGMPLFALETMAAGLPMVATNVGGMPEVVDDGRTGLLVPPQDPPALAKALVRVLGDKALAQRLGAANALRLPPYRMETVAGQFANLYDELLARRHASTILAG